MDSNYIDGRAYDALLMKTLFRKTYVWMTFALFITAMSALITVKNPALMQFFLGSTMGMWGLIIATFALVFILSSRILKMSMLTATIMFIVYSMLNGVMLSSIFLVYDLGAISRAFFVTAGTFAATSLYGYVTKTDLSRFGNILLMALIGLIIATLVNLFLKSTMMDIIISYAGVIIFVGLTAWDTQNLKRLYLQASDMGDSALKIALLGALTLYLDFINLFLYLLRIFGSSRD